MDTAFEIYTGRNEVAGGGLARAGLLAVAIRLDTSRSDSLLSARVGVIRSKRHGHTSRGPTRSTGMAGLVRRRLCHTDAVVALHTWSRAHRRLGLHAGWRSFSARSCGLAGSARRPRPRRRSPRSRQGLPRRLSLRRPRWRRTPKYLSDVTLADPALVTYEQKQGNVALRALLTDGSAFCALLKRGGGIDEALVAEATGVRGTESQTHLPSVGDDLQHHRGRGAPDDSALPSRSWFQLGPDENPQPREGSGHAIGLSRRRGRTGSVAATT